MILHEERVLIAQEVRDSYVREDWERVVELAEGALQRDPEWFVPATWRQTAWIEIVGKKYPHDSTVQAAVEANRLVRKLAKEQTV